MNKKITEKTGWFYIAIGCVVISLLSLFLPILRYTDEQMAISFNIVDLIGGNEYFEAYVIDAYYGPVIWNISQTATTVLAVIAIIALICAVVGLLTLRVQRPNTKQFILTIVGLVGVSIPSVTVIVIVLLFGKYYYGTLTLGIAPVISPIALLISIGAVIRRKNKVAEEIQRELEAKGLIWKAGDL